MRGISTLLEKNEDTFLNTIRYLGSVVPESEPCPKVPRAGYGLPFFVHVFKRIFS